MPHLKDLFCGRQKRDNTCTIKMFHQMSIWVVVVALGLVPISICVEIIAEIIPYAIFLCNVINYTN